MTTKPALDISAELYLVMGMSNELRNVEFVKEHHVHELCQERTLYENYVETQLSDSACAESFICVVMMDTR